MKQLIAFSFLATITGGAGATILYAQDCPRPGCLAYSPPEVKYHYYPAYLGAPTSCMMPDWSYSDYYSRARGATYGTSYYAAGCPYRNGACGCGLRCGFGCSPSYNGVSPPAFGTPTPFVSPKPLVVPAPAPRPAAPAEPSEP